MFEGQNKRVAVVYALLQVIIWAKTVWFFSLYGFGRVGDFNRAFFPGNAILLDFVFHEAIHVAIGILALLFGKNLSKIEWLKLTGVIFVAVFMHNILYWFTATHISAAYSVLDFVTDSVILMAFVVAGFVFRKQIARLEALVKPAHAPQP